MINRNRVFLWFFTLNEFQAVCLNGIFFTVLFSLAPTHLFIYFCGIVIPSSKQCLPTCLSVFFFLHMHGNFGLCPDHCGSFCMHICRCLPVNECLTTFGLRAHCLTLQQTASLFLLRRELCVFIQLLDVWVM